MFCLKAKVLIVLSLLILCSCRKDIEDYDKAPKWLKGNAWKLLESRGDCSLFLKAAELTGYKNLLDGAGLCTVFAPVDEAFNAWITEKGYGSVEEACQTHPQEMKILIAYHLVEQSFSRTQLLNFQMSEIETPGTVGTSPGLCFKYKSYAKEQVTEEYDQALKQNVKVYHREKYLPVVSTKMFETKEVNGEATYKDFFPQVNWKGDVDQLYVGNASMIESGLPTDNGYVYILDRMESPLRTLHTALQDPEDKFVEDNVDHTSVNFSTFFNMMERFKNYYYDQATSEKYAAPGEKYYFLYHNAAPRSRDKGVDLPELASEWCYHGQEDSKRASYNRYLSDNYNCFAFTNKAFENFALKNLPLSFQQDISQIPDITLYHLLLAHACDQQQILLPEEIVRKGISGQNGEEWKLGEQDMIYKEFCANGILYGIDSVFTPMVFNVITKPLFTSDKYSFVANMFQSSNEFVTIVDDEPEHYTLFIQSDDYLESLGFRINYHDDAFGDEKVEYKSSGSDFKEYASSDHIQRHIIYGYLEQEDFKGPAYYASKLPFNYIYVHNDSIFGGNGNGFEVEEATDVRSINGITWQLNGKLDESTQDLPNTINSSAEYLQFASKLMVAGLLKLDNNSKPSMDFLTSGERYMVFVPDDNALGLLPSEVITREDSTALADYLRYCFVPVRGNELSDYILPGFGEQGKMQMLSFRIQKSTAAGTVYSPIWVDNSITEDGLLKMEVTGEDGNQAKSDGNMARFVTNGVIFKMKGKFEEFATNK